MPHSMGMQIKWINPYRAITTMPDRKSFRKCGCVWFLWWALLFHEPVPSAQLKRERLEGRVLSLPLATVGTGSVVPWAPSAAWEPDPLRTANLSSLYLQTSALSLYAKHLILFFWLIAGESPWRFFQVISPLLQSCNSQTIPESIIETIWISWLIPSIQKFP